MALEAPARDLGVGTENRGRQAVVGSVGDASMADVAEALSAAAEEKEITDERQPPLSAENQS